MADFKDWLQETATGTNSIASFVRPCMPIVKRDPFGWSADSDKKKKKKRKKDESALNESADVIEEAKYIHTILSEREKKQEEIVPSADHEKKTNAGSSKKSTSGARCRITKPETKKKATCPTCGAKVDVDDLKKVPFSLQKNGIKKHICSKCPRA